jgi:DNA-binding NarL/FixJ family response regulator
MRDGLQVLLKAIPEVKIIDKVDNSSTALQVIAEQRPALVLLGYDLPGEETEAILKQAKATWPQSRCIALAGSVQQQYLAQTAGADDVLLVGFSAAAFFTTIETLLEEQTSQYQKI